MKELIDKLFEKLGYVPKDTYKTAREYAVIKLRLRQAISEHQKSSLGCKSRFRVSEHHIPSKNWVADGFLVEQITSMGGRGFFLFYVQLCAKS